jgi:rod shape determining protein RodA
MSQHNPAISKGIDWSLAWIYFLLVAIGIMAIFGATYVEGDSYCKAFLASKQIIVNSSIFFIVALGIGLLILLTDSKFFPATANIWYVAGLILLLLVFPFHSRVKGTESIIRLGGFQFQPAEFCKICVALALAKYLSRPETDFSKTRSQLIAAGIALLPAALTIMQKETGLALVFFAFFLVMYREGLPSLFLL